MAQHLYIVSALNPALPEVRVRNVQAAYFKHEERFTVFKDAAHDTVYSVSNDFLVDVERDADDE